MEMSLQPLATACFVTGQAFADGDAVASYLVRNDTTGNLEAYSQLQLKQQIAD